MTELVLDGKSGKMKRALTTLETEEDRVSAIAVLSESAGGFNRGMGKEKPRKSGRRRAPWLWAALVLLAIAGACLWAQWGRIRCYLQAGAVLAQLDGRSLPRMLDPIAGKPIKIEEFQLAISGGPLRARIYEPLGEAGGPGLVDRKSVV